MPVTPSVDEAYIAPVKLEAPDTESVPSVVILVLIVVAPKVAATTKNTDINTEIA